MNKILVFSLLAILFISCKDEFNLPEYPYIDEITPTIDIIYPDSNKMYIGQNIIPVEIKLSDDYDLYYFQMNIQPIGQTQPLLEFEKYIAFTDHVIDTFVNLTTRDSTTYNVLIYTEDYAGNSAQTEYQFSSKD